MDKKITRGLLITSAACFFLCSAALAMTVLGSKGQKEMQFPVTFMCGVCFWAFLLAGIILQIILSKYIKNWRIKTHRYRRDKNINPKIGVISFFKNPIGIASDITFIVSAITLVVSYIITGGTNIICYISLALTVFSFSAHCIFNGKNYYYITNHQKTEESSKRKAEESK